MADSTRATRPTTAADLHRLAALAHARGLHVTQEQPAVWFCSSASNPKPHYVTGLSCDCRGFQEHQRCTHYALLLERLGWLPEVRAETDDAAAVPVACGNCSGGGVIYVPDCACTGWPHPACLDYQGTGEIQRLTQSTSLDNSAAKEAA